MRSAIGSQPASASRRRLVRNALFASLGLAGAGALVGLVEYLLPSATGQRVHRKVGNVRDYPAGGAPVHFTGERPGTEVLRDGRGPGGFWLVHLDPTDRDLNGSGAESGFVALADYCTHLGCTVPWRAQFKFEGREGWFRCPCHGATFTKAGARVFGPTPRGLDYYPVAIDAGGTVQVDGTSVTRASRDKPAPAVPVPTHLLPAS